MMQMRSLGAQNLGQVARDLHLALADKKVPAIEFHFYFINVIISLHRNQWRVQCHVLPAEMRQFW
jgi:hypothetical protein